jgi:hypothetical protein
MGQPKAEHTDKSLWKQLCLEDAKEVFFEFREKPDGLATKPAVTDSYSQKKRGLDPQQSAIVCCNASFT